MSSSAPGFRRRRRHAGAAVLLDEAAALIQADPLGWAARALLPSLPAALLALLFIHLHRVSWAREPWSVRTTLLSLGLSLLLLGAWLLRAVGQGAAAREVAARLDPRPAGWPPMNASALVVLACISAAAASIGGLAAVIPGLAAGGFFLPAFAVSACEGRDAPSTLRRLQALPRGTVGKGMAAVLIFSLLWLFCWLDVILGVQGLLGAAHVLWGADVGLLRRVLGPTSPSFVLSAGVVAGLLVDGLWCVFCGVFYVDARLSQSGADLLDRWDELEGPPGAALLMLAALLLLPAGVRAEEGGGGGEEVTSWVEASAERPERDGGRAPRSLATVAEGVLREADPRRGRTGEPPRIGHAQGSAGADGGVEASAERPERDGGQAPSYRDRLLGWVEELDEGLDTYQRSGFQDQSALREDLVNEPPHQIDTPWGPLDMDGAILGEFCPEWIHTDDSEAKTRALRDRLDRAAAYLLVLEEMPPGTELGGRPPGQGPRDLLRREFSEQPYQLAPGRGGADGLREGLEERLRRWLTELFSGPEPRPAPPPVAPKGLGLHGRWAVAGMALILTVAMITLLLKRGGAAAIPPPEGDPSDDGPAGRLPDARRRTPRGWRGHADDLADAGRYREAVRAQFLAVLAGLDRSGEITYRRGRTNGEHLRSFRGEALRRRRFEGATRTFDALWYGEEPARREDYDRMSKRCSGLLGGGRLPPTRLEGEGSRA